MSLKEEDREVRDYCDWQAEVNPVCRHLKRDRVGNCDLLTVSHRVLSCLCNDTEDGVFSCDSEREERKSRAAISSGPGSTVSDKSFIQEGGGFLLTRLISLSLSLSVSPAHSLPLSLYISLVRLLSTRLYLSISLSFTLPRSLHISLLHAYSTLLSPLSLSPPSSLPLSE